MGEILVIGQGNIGTFMGATLSINHSVIHYVRDKKKARKKIVLNFTDRRSKVFRLSKGKIYKYSLTDHLSEINYFDYIIIAVSHNQVRNLVDFLIPIISLKQTLVIMGNVWDDFNWFEVNIKTPYIFVFLNFGGAIVSNKLEGWLTPNFTTGTIEANSNNKSKEFNSLLQNVGFKTKEETDIKGWLMTHFAYNAGMLLEAANQNGFQTMSKKWKSLNNMYALIRECMQVTTELNIDIRKYSEGKNAFHPIWWNVFKTYFIFLMPGLAKNADATKDLDEWKSYGKKIYMTSKKSKIKAPLLGLNYRVPILDE